MAIHRHYAKYRTSAASFNRSFSISEEEFTKLVESPCFYCGRPPFVAHTHRSPTRQSVLLHGVDRLDSQRGYDQDNVVTACKECNLGKHSKTPEQFIEMCRLVAERYPRHEQAS